MAAEQVLELLDYYWFETTIFTKKVGSTSKSENQVDHTSLSRTPTLQVIRSFSDQNLASKVSFSSDSPSPPKLRTIHSGKEVKEFPEEEEETIKKKVGRPRRRKSGRSLSELEFKELKGFMDLGFVFSEEDKDSSKLVSLIPGLQRVRRTGEEGIEELKKIDESVIYRPYLSEAWGVIDERKIENPLLNWRVPSPGNETDTKDNLRFWAQAVASIVT